MASSTSLSIAVAQAVAYLTRPLSLAHPSTTITRLQLILEANLTALFAPTWTPKEPLRGSGRRCLTLSPNCLPPRAIYSACVSADVQWFDWIALLGGREFDLLVDPGRVSIRYGADTVHTIWSDPANSLISPTPSRPSSLLDEGFIQAHLQAQINARAKVQSKTLAQRLLEDDQEENEIFALIADEVTDPAWTPIIDQFPMVPRSSSSLSTFSTHSRSSSSSSNSSSCYSVDGFGSSSLSSSPESKAPGLPQLKQSRRERARQARVYVDTSKNEVTPYDGGKTTVLTGGVMLGAKAPSAPKKVSKPATTPTASTWRFCRA